MFTRDTTLYSSLDTQNRFNILYNRDDSEISTKTVKTQLIHLVLFVFLFNFQIFIQDLNDRYF